MRIKQNKTEENVKRTTVFIVAVLLILATLLTACQQSTSKVIVATDATFKPFEYVDDNQQIVGFDIDLMNKIAEKAGLQIEWVNVPFDSVLAGLSECQYDIGAAAISITEEREQSMLFSDPYLDAGQIVVVKKDNTTILSKDDLKNKKVAAQLGTTGEIEAQKIEGVEYKPYDTYDLAFLDLMNGQVDAVIADNPVAMGFIAANPDKIKSTGPVFNSEVYGLALCKKDTDLQAKINKALKELIDSGYVSELAQKHLTASE